MSSCAAREMVKFPFIATNLCRGVVITIAFALGFGVSAPVCAQKTSSPDLGNAEVFVTSSSNVDFVGMANTDGHGHFMLNGVPAGGINVVVRRNGVVIARGAAVTEGGSLNEAQMLNIRLVPPENTLKSVPIGAMSQTSQPVASGNRVATDSASSASGSSSAANRGVRGKPTKKPKKKSTKKSTPAKKKPPR